MEKIVVEGGKTLQGEVDISVAKNSVLPIMVASILAEDKVKIKNIPILDDVIVLCNLLNELKCYIDISKGDLIIDTSNTKPMDASGKLIRKMRASFLFIGPMLARFGHCKISLPGGCNIGSRPIDLHLKGLKALGANINMGHGYVEATANKLYGSRIYLDFPSVGATENIIMAAVLAEGTTVIENAGQEPEICDLINFLNQMGARIEGAGTTKITVRGVKKLKGIEYKPIYDRIEAGTFIVAAAMTNSVIKLNNINDEYIRPLIEKLKECGIKFNNIGNSIIVDGRGDKKPIDIKTMPYPGFPTDMQPQIMSLLSIVKGSSIITETVFENRFMHVQELVRLGANIKIDGRTAFVEGVDKLTGGEVKATDLRAGAAMVLAGLACDGITSISDIYHIDRGYVNIEDKFIKLGANIKRIKM